MRTKLWIAICKILAIVLFIRGTAFALNPSTHRAINLEVANSTMNGFSLDQYLKSNLDILQGTAEKFDGERVDVWLELGGRYEDEPPWTLPYLRSVNHFHNPLTEEGFSGFFFGLFLSGDSSLQWAQWPQGTQDPEGYYSWHDVRDYYYNALTSADQNTRNTYFSQTFRGLGQLMHLVQDLSVPEHTRDDFHPFGGYEGWVANPRNNVDISSYSPVFFDLNALGQPNPLASVPIANLFDTNQYNGTNPNVTLNQNIGLSEFANANFLSKDTIITSGFPYPSRSSLELWIDGTNNRQYLRKSAEGIPVDHLATVSLLYWYRQTNYPQYDEYLPVGLDSTVYSEYASLLLPRAVGYSASLLNYFFRGDIETTGFSYTSTSVTANIRNDTRVDPTDSNSAIEVMGPGELLVSYSYIDNQGNTVYGSSDIFYVTTVPSVGNTPMNLTFTLTAPIPSDAVDVSFIFVYRGALGNEADAVVAAPPSTRIVYGHQPGGPGPDNPSYIYSIDPDGRNNIQITNELDGYTWDFDPDLSRDGTKLAFAGAAPRDIVVVDMTSQVSYPGNIITILDSTPVGQSGNEEEISPAWSPDGTEIAASWLTAGTLSEALIFNVVTGTSRQVTSDTALDWVDTMSWSPDGSKLAFAAWTSTNEWWDIYTINTDGTGLTMLTNDAYNDVGPKWSPDGSQIGFVSDRDDGTTSNLWIMNADGTNPLRITDFPFSNNDALSLDWSPNGKQIVISGGNGFGSELYVINLDEKSLYQLTDDGLTSFNGSPSWSYK